MWLLRRGNRGWNEGSQVEHSSVSETNSSGANLPPGPHLILTSAFHQFWFSFLSNFIYLFFVSAGDENWGLEHFGKHPTTELHPSLALKFWVLVMLYPHPLFRAEGPAEEVRG
jgi:hypothetical protein